MKYPTVVTVLGLLTTLLTATASATRDYNADDIQRLIIAEAKRQNVPTSLALAIAKVESDFDHQALRHAGAKGVMQIMPRTAEQVFGVSRHRLFEPDVNIELGVKFIKKLLQRYDGRLDIALSHYNGGSGVKNKYGVLRVMPVTRGYVDKVLAIQQKFLRFNDQGTFASQINQSSIHNVDNVSSVNNVGNTAQKFQAGAKVIDTYPENTQVETLRALRVHNMTRNYKGKKATSFVSDPVNIKQSPSVNFVHNTKISKVRQWESIYTD